MFRKCQRGGKFRVRITSDDYVTDYSWSRVSPRATTLLCFLDETQGHFEATPVDGTWNMEQNYPAISQSVDLHHNMFGYSDQ
eukprot:scaffold78570_cov57-Attheya_sp.AAC.8